MGYCISGRMKVVMDDGEEQEFGPGDFMICPPGHDAWIVGDEACVFIDWHGFADYAKRSSAVTATLHGGNLRRLGPWMGPSRAPSL
jgi:hypothetical protein